jgi:hypothetical protein
MSEEWPSPPQRPDHPPLPRVEDLPGAPEGYDRASVEDAFDSFYRHLAQLDSTLKTLEEVEVFRRQSEELRAELRSIRAAGWSPYPRGYPLAPTPSVGFDLPAAVPRIALEVVFLIAVAVTVAVANLKAIEIVLVMVIAFAITALVEWIASREGGPFARPAVATEASARPPAPVDAAASEPEPLSDGAGWAAFAEPSGPEALTVMGALSDGEVVELEDIPAEPVAEVTAEEQETEPEPEPQAETTEEFEAVEEHTPVDEAEPESEPAALDVAALVAEVDAKTPPEEPPAAAAEPERAGRVRRRRRAKAEPVAEVIAEPEQETEPVAAAEPQPEPEPEQQADEVVEAEPEPDPVLEEEPILIEEETDEGPRRRWAWRRRLREEPEEELDEELVPEPPKHVRILPAPEPVLARDLDPWERGFDFDLDDEEEADVDAVAVDENEASLRRPGR